MSDGAPGIRWRVRAAQAVDLPSLQRIFVEASLSNTGDRENLLAHPEALQLGPLDLPSGHTRVGVDGDGDIGGFTTITPGDGVWQLEDLFVDPARMRQGCARALVDDVVARARSTGCRRIEVTANPHALAFYAEVGFILDGASATQFGPAPRMHRLVD